MIDNLWVCPRCLELERNVHIADSCGCGPRLAEAFDVPGSKELSTTGWKNTEENIELPI